MKKPEETIVDLVPEIFIQYKAKLNKSLEGFESGSVLDAILLPICIDRKNDKWENKWFVYSGDKLIVILPFDKQCFSLSIAKKKEKK